MRSHVEHSSKKLSLCFAEERKSKLWNEIRVYKRWKILFFLSELFLKGIFKPWIYLLVGCKTPILILCVCGHCTSNEISWIEWHLSWYNETLWNNPSLSFTRRRNPCLVTRGAFLDLLGCLCGCLPVSISGKSSNTRNTSVMCVLSLSLVYVPEKWVYLTLCYSECESLIEEEC